MERTLNRFITLIREKFVATCTRLDEMRNEDGLTLIELLAVVVILGIIATFAVPTVSGAITRSKLNTTLTTEGTIQQALERYDFDHGQYPTQLSQLTEQTDATGAQYASSDSTGPFGPYLNSVFPQNDGWGNPIYYTAMNSKSDGSGTVVGYVILSGDGVALSSTNASSVTSSTLTTGSTPVTTFVYAAGGSDLSNSIGYTPTAGTLPGFTSGNPATSTKLAGDLFGSTYSSSPTLSDK